MGGLPYFLEVGKHNNIKVMFSSRKIVKKKNEEI